MNELNELEKFRNGSGAVANIKVNGQTIKKIKPSSISMKETVYDPTEENSEENSEETEKEIAETQQEIKPLRQVTFNDEIKKKINLHKEPKEDDIKKIAISLLPYYNDEDNEKACAKAIEKAIVFENVWRKVWEKESE